jgi:hypothetical protein
VKARKGSSSPADRRSGADRRIADKGPTSGRPERRRSVEPRMPEVVEIEMSISQWSALIYGDQDTEQRGKTSESGG